MDAKKARKLALEVKIKSDEYSTIKSKIQYAVTRGDISIVINEDVSESVKAILVGEFYNVDKVPYGTKISW